MNQVLIDHDGTASTDFDDKTKTSPQVLAVIGNDSLALLFCTHHFSCVARLRVALEKLDGAVLETRACLDGRLSPARELSVIVLLRNVHNVRFFR